MCKERASSWPTAIMFTILAILVALCARQCPRAIDTEIRSTASAIRQHHDMVRAEYRLNEMDKGLDERAAAEYWLGIS